MKKRTPISSIMTPHVDTVNITHNLHDVKKLFENNHYHHVPVVSGDKLIGIISRTDLARISFVADATDHKLSTAMYDVLSLDHVMQKDVVTLTSRDTVQHATEVFLSNDFHGLPVVDDGKIVGIVTTQDLIKYLHENLN